MDSVDCRDDLHRDLNRWYGRSRLVGLFENIERVVNFRPHAQNLNDAQKFAFRATELDFGCA